MINPDCKCGCTQEQYDYLVDAFENAWLGMLWYGKVVEVLTESLNDMWGAFTDGRV